MNKRKNCRALRVVFPIFVAVSMMLISGCTEENLSPSPEPAIAAHFTTYTDIEEPGLFSISYPADWELDLSETKLFEQLSQVELE